MPSFGQYKKLIDENKMWVVHDDYNAWMAWPSYSYDSYYYEYFKGDTIYQNKTYKKLYHQEFYFQEHQPPYTIDSSLQQPKLVGLAREDTVTKQVFFVDYPHLLYAFLHEELLFDFSVVSGDTITPLFYAPGPFYQSTHTVDSLSQIVLPNNDTCKVVHFDFDWGIFLAGFFSNFMIEGVGGPGGIYAPFNEDFETSITRTLLCYQENGINLLGDCIFPNSISENTNSISFDIYPNPTFGKFTIELEKPDKANITIYNIAGKKVFNKHYTSNELIEINLDAPNGLYFIKVETDKGVFTEKIIKQ